jgi:hypothetical protein
MSLDRIDADNLGGTAAHQHSFGCVRARIVA